MRGKSCGRWLRRKKPIAARDGAGCTVRIMPYQTLDDRIDGVVITFADITVAKALEAKLRDHHPLCEKALAGQSAKFGTWRKKPCGRRSPTANERGRFGKTHETGPI